MKKLLTLTLLSTACAGADGTDGTDGRDGRDGSDGETPEVSVRDASDDDCPAGGTELQVGEETVVLCDGEPGESGEPGPAGEPGMDAETGESIGRIAVTMFCNGPLDETPSMYATHSIVAFTDGSVWVSASITNGLNQASDSRFFAPEQLGAATAEVVLVFDVVAPDIGGYWIVNVDPVTLASTIEYFDADWSGVSLWRMSASDCVVQQY